MKKIIIGSILIILGLFGLSAFSSALFTIIAGTLPLVLIIGGGVTVFLNLNDDAFGEMDVTSTEPVVKDKLEPAGAPVVSSAPTSEPAPEPTPAPEPEPDPAPEPEATPEPEPEPTPEPAPEPAASDAAGAANFFGNTGSMVFHSAACKYAANKNCTATFSAKDEAIEAGYKPCKVCCSE